MTQGTWDNETVYGMIDTIEELLEVLRGVERTLRNAVASTHVSEKQREIWHNEVVKISAAIDNATGGES